MSEVEKKRCWAVNLVAVALLLVAFFVIGYIVVSIENLEHIDEEERMKLCAQHQEDLDVCFSVVYGMGHASFDQKIESMSRIHQQMHKYLEENNMVCDTGTYLCHVKGD